jgi:putative glutamine amidotransferase
MPLKIGLSYTEGKPKYRLYAEALVEAGARFGMAVEPVWLAGIAKPFDAKALDGLAGVVLTGGADVVPERYGFADPNGLCRFTLPERDEVEFPLVEAVLERGVPILAICRGMQMLNVVCGGSLVPDLPGHDWEDDSARHAVSLASGSFLAERVTGRTEGNVSSSHHQAVDRPGNGLRVVGTSADGIVEAIEWADPQKKPWLVAVQWHPERMSLDEPLSGSLYGGFLEAVIKCSL